MLAEGSEPNILELEKLVASLCKHLREATPGIEDPKMSAEVSHYLKVLENANKDLVTEYAKATNEYEEALQKMKDRPQREVPKAPEPPKAPEAPKPPPEEDVLPIGLTLRDQLLKRFGVPSKSVAAPAVDSSGSIAQHWTETDHPKSKGEAPAPPPPAGKPVLKPKSSKPLTQPPAAPKPKAAPPPGHDESLGKMGFDDDD